MATCPYNVARVPSHNLQNQHKIYHSVTTTISLEKRASTKQKCRKDVIKCGREILEFIGGDLVKLDIGKWLSDVEKHKALAIYTPHEGGYEGRYLNRLRYQGYEFLDLTARGLGDPETTLTKIHPVCPAHVGKQPIARWYFPPEVDYRLSLLPPNAKGLVVWIIEAKVLSKAELQFLALLPSLRPRVRVIAECGNCSFDQICRLRRRHNSSGRATPPIINRLWELFSLPAKGFVEAAPRYCRLTGMRRSFIYRNSNENLNKCHKKNS